MAKIKLENTREHEISICGIDENGELVSVTVPGARTSPTDKDEVINGSVEADDSFVDAIKAKSKAVQHYFDEGWLIAPAATTSKKKAAADKPE